MCEDIKICLPSVTFFGGHSHNNMSKNVKWSFLRKKCIKKSLKIPEYQINNCYVLFRHPWAMCEARKSCIHL